MNEAKTEGTSALVLDTKEKVRVAKPPEEAKLDNAVSLIEQQASTVVIASDQDFEKAGELTKRVKKMQKQVTDYWEHMRKSTYEAYTAVNAHKKEMLSFYFDLSGVGSGPAVNRNTAKRAAAVISALSARLHEIESLYLDTIRQDTVPRPIMSVRDSLCVFEMCLEGRFDEAEDVVEKFARCVSV